MTVVVVTSFGPGPATDDEVVPCTFEVLVAVDVVWL